MRYCFSCRHITSGKPLFCNHCGRSYNVKFCPRLHVNPRGAEACSQCGSQELSMPQYYESWWRKALFMFSTISGVVLMLGSVLYALFFGYELFLHPTSVLRPMLVGLVLGLLWLAYVTIF